jgi:hypothetical protein
MAVSKRTVPERIPLTLSIPAHLDLTVAALTRILHLVHTALRFCRPRCLSALLLLQLLRAPRTYHAASIRQAHAPLPHDTAQQNKPCSCSNQHHGTDRLNTHV